MNTLQFYFKEKVNKSDWSVIIIFLIIFVTYFVSSVGLINSGDTPQYFTTEAIIKHQSLDMSFFANDPHYFIYPDYFIQNEQILSMRGYVFSFITIPIHLLSTLVKHYLNSTNFESIVVTQNFNYELAITSIFTGFSVAGLYFIYLTLKKYSNKTIALISVLLFAFGSFIWKYSALYARHGLMVFAIGLFIYQSYIFVQNKNKHKNYLSLAINMLITSVIFGVDIIIFLTFVLANIYLIIMHLFEIRKAKQEVIKPYHKINKSTFYIVVLASIIFFIQLILNYHFYNSPLASQNTKNVVLMQSELNKKDMSKAWSSTPFWPTILVVLFNYSTIPSESFSNYDSLPKIFYEYASVDFAKKYEFYGLFIISPFILLTLILNFKIDKNKVLGLAMFLSSVAINSKVLCFWAGNQYDVRYFYPYILFLSFFVADFLKKTIRSKKYINCLILYFSFFILSSFSIFMGWLGVINMFKPALTGERKIWLTLSNLSYLKQIDKQTLINATFPNRENWATAVVLYFVFLIIVRKVIFFTDYYTKQQTKKIC